MTSPVLLPALILSLALPASAARTTSRPRAERAASLHAPAVVGAAPSGGGLPALGASAVEDGKTSADKPRVEAAGAVAGAQAELPPSKAPSIIKRLAERNRVLDEKAAARKSGAASKSARDLASGASAGAVMDGAATREESGEPVVLTRGQKRVQRLERWEEKLDARARKRPSGGAVAQAIARVEANEVLAKQTREEAVRSYVRHVTAWTFGGVFTMSATMIGLSMAGPGASLLGAVVGLPLYLILYFYLSSRGDSMTLGEAKFLYFPFTAATGGMLMATGLGLPMEWILAVLGIAVSIFSLALIGAFISASSVTISQLNGLSKWLLGYLAAVVASIVGTLIWGAMPAGAVILMSLVGLGIFTAMAFLAAKLVREMAMEAADSRTGKRGAVMAAMTLFIAFANIVAELLKIALQIYIETQKNK